MEKVKQVIAVICRSKDVGLSFLELDILKGQKILINRKFSEVETDTTRYLLVTRREEILPYEFSSYLIAPDYDDLIESVKSRIRPSKIKKNSKLPEEDLLSKIDKIRNGKVLTEWEENFVGSVLKQLNRKGKLSDKQIAILDKIYKEKSL